MELILLSTKSDEMQLRFWSEYWQNHNYRKYKVSINNSGHNHIWKSLKLTLLLNGNDDIFQILKDKDSTSCFTVSRNLV